MTTYGSSKFTTDSTKIIICTIKLKIYLNIQDKKKEKKKLQNKICRK